ncbi:MAG TPA: PAS domain S-box protein, partial [Tepidisphaeraceae bacterium]
LNEELTTVNAQLQAKMDELERTTNDLSSLLASTDIAVIFLDTKFRIRRFTPAVKDLVEMISADIGRPMRDLAPKYDDPQLLPDAQAVLEKLIPIEREIVAGEHTYLRRVLPYRTGDNRIDGVVVTFTDITGRVKAEAALRNSEEEYRLIVHGVKDHAIFAIDLDGRIATWNPGAERVLGYSQAEAVGQPAAMIFTPEDRAAAAPEAERSEAVRTGRGIDERWHVRKDGSQFWASGSLAAVYDDNGKPRAFVKVMRDMTEQKQAAEAQRLSEERLRRAIGIETVGVIFFKADGSITEANDAFLRMSGYTRDDLAVGSVRWDTQTPHEFMPQSLKAVNEFLTHGRTTPYEKQYIRKDGSRWWALFAAARVSDDEGVEFIVDITESKRAEVALMESEARFRGVADVVGEMLWQCDPDGKPVWHNQRWTDFTGLTTEQSMQDEWMKTVHPDDVEETRVTFRESIRSGEPWRREHRIRRASDGAYRWFLVQGMPQRDGNGRIRSWFGSVTDIHEQRTTLDALRESDERYRAVVETSENAIFRISADTVTLLEMRGGGFLQDETAAKPNWVDAYVHPGDRQTVLAAWREALESRTHFSLEHRVRRADGSWGWSYSRAVPLEKEPGHLLEWFGVASDITVRKQEEEERTALLEQERDSRGEAELANSAK